MTTTVTLYELADEYMHIARQLQESDLPVEAVNDTLEGLTLPIEEKARAVAVVIANMQENEELVQQAIDKLSERLKRIAARREWLTGYLKVNMQRTGITKIEHPLLKISLRKNPVKVVIDSPVDVPLDYYGPQKPPPPREISKTLIKAAIEAGKIVPGAHLAQDERVEIKV